MERPHPPCWRRCCSRPHRPERRITRGSKARPSQRTPSQLRMPLTAAAALVSGCHCLSLAATGSGMAGEAFCWRGSATGFLLLYFVRGKGLRIFGIHWKEEILSEDKFLWPPGSKSTNRTFVPRAVFRGRLVICRGQAGPVVHAPGPGLALFFPFFLILL